MSSLTRGQSRGRARPRDAPNGAQSNHIPASNGMVRGMPASLKRVTPRGRGGGWSQSSPGLGRGSSQATAHQPFRKSGLSLVQNAKGNWQERYNVLESTRKREREDAIKRGLMADPDKPTTLAEAITLVGTCPDMCAEFERVERVVQKDVWKEEVDISRISSNSLDREPDETRMVKKFRRAAAGIEEQLPSDLRPPPVLQRTCDYLFSDVVGAADDLGSVHHFVWDRTRAIRNDFSIQQLTRPEDLAIAVNCYEQIARFHILSLHQLALSEKPYEKYDWQQEREQLDRTLLSLIQYYDDSRSKISPVNEAEFRAYCVIFQLRNPDPDLEDKVQSWPRDIASHPRVRAALRLYAAACNTIDAYGPLKPAVAHATAQQDWHSVWRLVESPQISYLMACVAEIHFNTIRENILHALLRSVSIKNMVQWTIEELRSMLAFDTEDGLVEFCARYDLAFNAREGRLLLDFSALKMRPLPQAKANAAKQLKTDLVEQKRGGRLFPAIINGLSFKQAAELGMVIEPADSDMEVVDQQSHDEEMDAANSSDDGLFVSQNTAKTDAKFFALSSQSESEQIPTTSKPSTPGFPVQQPGVVMLSGSENPVSATTRQEAQSVFNFTKPSIVSSARTSTFGQPSNPSNSTIPNSSIFAASAQPANLSTPSVFDFTAALKQAQKPPVPTNHDLFKGFGTASTPAQQSVNDTAQSAAPSFTQPNPSNMSTSLGTFSALHASDQATEPVSQPAASEGILASAISSPLIFDFSKSKSKDQHGKTVQLEPLANTSFSTIPSNPFNTITSLPPAQKKVSFDFGATNSTPALQSFASQSVPQPSPTPTSSAKPAEASQFIPDKSRFAKNDPDSATQFKQNSSQPVHAAGPMVRLADIAPRLAEDLIFEPKTGFLKQYLDFVLGQIVTEVQEQVYDERLEEQAVLFRHEVLATRYGHMWRDIYRRNKMSKQARARRNRAFQRLNDHKSNSSAASSVAGDSVLGHQQANTSRYNVSSTSKREFVDKLFQQSTKAGRWTKAAAEHVNSESARRRSSSSYLDQAVSEPSQRTKVSRLDSSGRIVKPSPTISDKRTVPGLNHSSPVRSTTKSSYFRMKALGLDKVDASIASSRKRGFSELSSNISEQSWTPPGAAEHLITDYDHTQSGETPSSPRSKMLKMYDEEDALFARLKAARASLQDGMSFYKTEVAKSTSPQSDHNMISARIYDSPSMQRARQEARWRHHNRSVPAYQLRESRFVPRRPVSAVQTPVREVQASSPDSPAAVLDLRQDAAVSLPPVGADRTVDTQQTGTSHTFQASQSQTLAGDSYTNGHHIYPPPTDPIPTFAEQPVLASFTDSGRDVDANVGHGLITHDFTIKPSQIPDSLAASFGPPLNRSSYGLESQPGAGNGVGLFPTSEDSHLAKPYGDSTDTDHADIEVYPAHFDVSNPDLAAFPLASHNPFAVLQNKLSSPDAQYNEVDVQDDEDDSYEHENVPTYLRNGMVSYEHEYQQADDADVSEDEHNEVEEGEAEDYIGDDEDDDDMDEDEDEDEEEDEDEDEDEDEAVGKNDSYASDQSEFSTDEDIEVPPVNEALQIVGHTEADAIELSD